MRRGTILLALSFTGCVLDWSTPGAPRDASVAEEAAVDSGADAPLDVATKDGALECSQRVVALAEARSKAQACASGPNQCAVKVQDECGCGRYGNGGTATTQWVAALQAFATSGCTPSCNGPCPFVPPTGLCLVSDGGLGCSP